ncbi:uncharacterized protein RB166_006785 isoform 2-T3 [Leptodactylus fuscus]|uniref:uncharacterized protein LOC142200564 isoform X2 n=1 Tax=Leptodactylus fuscus TaxID=238119 RepID=UPI003F4E5607
MQTNNKGNQNVSSTIQNQHAKSKFSCTDCSFTCNSLQNYRIHLQNVHHKENENFQKMSAIKKTDNPKGKSAVNIQPADITGTILGSSGGNIAKLKDYISRVDREPLIGLEYVLEYCYKTKANQIEIRYFCELCECDTDLDPMVEHLAGFGHRKHYLAKEYPYVLKAQSSSKEDQSLFIRRMALEIEREEGTKMYMMDPSIWMDTMITLRTADKKRKKTRWNDDKNDETRMKKALIFLETFEIESEIEATTVARLCEKLTANVKFYNTKAKEEALFPARVARAQDVAMSLMKNVARQSIPLQNPNPNPQVPPKFDKRTPTLPENAILKNTVGMQSGYPGQNVHINAKQNMPKGPLFPQARQNPAVPFNKTPVMQGPSMPTLKENRQVAKNTQSDDSFLKTISQEDTQFLKKLMVLLEALPQNASPSDSTQMNSKLLMLKSLLVNQKNTEHEQENQKLMTQIASMVQDTISAQNASLSQQLMMLVNSQNSTMVMQTASHANNLMAPGNMQPHGNPVMSGAGLVPGIQSSGTMQENMNSLMSFNQNFRSQEYGDEMTRMNQKMYQAPQVAMQNYPSTSQNYDNFGYGNSVEGKYLSEGDSYISHHDGGINPLSTRQNEQTLNPYTDKDYEPSVYDKKWDNFCYDHPTTQEPRYIDHTEEKAPYTRICLSPSSPQNYYDDYNDNMREETGMQAMRNRPSLRSYSSSDWDDHEGNMRYTKRARLDMSTRSDKSDQSLEFLGINTAGMPEELLKRIKGKDLFTASAIISEYSEKNSGK